MVCFHVWVEEKLIDCHDPNTANKKRTPGDESIGKPHILIENRTRKIFKEELIKC